MLLLGHYAVDGERVVEVVLRVVLLDPQVWLLQEKRVLLGREQVLANEGTRKRAGGQQFFPVRFGVQPDSSII